LAIAAGCESCGGTNFREERPDGKDWT
jgi:hypothetical protein